MPYTIKSQQIAVKDPDTGAYVGVDLLTEQTTEGFLNEIEVKGTTVKNEVDGYIADARDDIDQLETDAATLVSNTQSSINTLSSQAQMTVNTMNSNIATATQAVDAAVQQGVDPTLTLSGIPADAAACGGITGLGSKAPVILETASGDIASFSDGADNMPIKSLVVTIEFMQEGSGDPSPDNIRPISSWTGLTLSHSGADISDSDTISVNWQSTGSEVCSGTVNVITGGLKANIVKHVVNENDSVAISGTPSDNRIVVYIPFADMKYNGVLYSNMFSPNLPSTAVWRIAETSNGRIYFSLDSSIAGTTAASVKTWMISHGVEISYELASPIERQLTPQKVMTLLGTNHFWADVGPVEVTYPADMWTYLDNPTNGAMPFRSTLTESLFTNYCEAMNLMNPSATNRRSIKIKGNVVHVSPLIDPANGSTYYSFILNKPTRYVGSTITNFTPKLVADDFSRIHLTNTQRLVINLSILYSKAASTTTYDGSITTGALFVATYDPVTETATVAQIAGPLGVVEGLERSINITVDITHQLPAIRDNGNICIIFQSRFPFMKEKWVIDPHIETDVAHNPDILLYGEDYRNNTSAAEKNIAAGTYIMQNGALLQATENIAVDTELAGKVSGKTLLGILNDFETRLRALE